MYNSAHNSHDDSARVATLIRRAYESVLPIALNRHGAKYLAYLLISFIKGNVRDSVCERCRRKYDKAGLKKCFDYM